MKKRQMKRKRTAKLTEFGYIKGSKEEEETKSFKKLPKEEQYKAYFDFLDGLKNKINK